MPTPVTDPALLEQLEGRKPISDPALLERLNAPANVQQQAGEMALEGMPAWQVGLAGAGRQMAGRARSLGNAMGMVSDESLKESQARDAPLAQRTAGKVGAAGADIAMSLPFMRGGLGGAALSGALMGFTDPDVKVGDTKDRMMKTGIGGTLGAVGEKVGQWAGKRIQDKLAQAMVRKAQDTPKREALEAGMKLGMVVPPSASNPKMGNRLLESFAGKEAIEQEASLINGEKMQNAMRKFLGLPETAPMTMDTLKQLRQSAGAAYDEAKGLGGTFLMDAKFLQKLQDLEGAAGTAGRSFPGLGNAENVRAALAPLRQMRFKPADAVDAVKALRESAGEAFANRQKSMGRAMIGAAREMEDLIERNIERQVGLGQVGGDYAKQTLGRFREARKSIAKSYAVESVINKATGNVRGNQAAKLIAKDAPVTGELATVAKFAAAFPTATREQTRSPGVNALTTLFGVEAAMLGHPAPLLLPPARFAMGKALLSKSFQKARAIPSYQRSNKSLRTVQGLGRTAAPLYFAADGEGQDDE